MSENLIDNPTPQDDESEGAPGWIVTFADMMSLLLCFFVLLLSFSTTDAKKFKQAAESLKQSFQFMKMPIPGERDMAAPQPSDDSIMQRPPMLGAGPSNPAQHLRMAKEAIDEYINRSGLSDHIQTMIAENRLEIINSNPLNFPAGKSELLESSEQYLDAIVPVVQEFDFDVIIAGHTDNIPISTVEFRSNWDLSAARAASFVHYLEAKGVDPTRLSVQGYGPYKPVAENDTEEGRARNRRIEIMLQPRG